jgi:hypothetical protein
MQLAGREFDTLDLRLGLPNDLFTSGFSTKILISVHTPHKNSHFILKGQLEKARRNSTGWFLSYLQTQFPVLLPFIPFAPLSCLEVLLKIS